MTQRIVLLLLVLGCAAPGQTPSGDALSPADTAVREEPGLKQFPKELLKNFVALASTDNLAPLAIGVAGTAAAKLPNSSLESFFAGKQEYGFQEGGEYAGAPWVAAPAVAGMFFLGQKSDDARFRRFTYSLAQGYVINQSIVMGIKKAVGSERPNGENSLSFPSGHTSGAFTWATTVDHYYGHKAGIVAYLAASYVGYSRLDERAHRLTDVVAGATIGYIVGKTISRRANPDRRVDWNVVVPPGGGVGLAFQFHLPH